jgi:uncharacterized membrane protein YgdD (TMEM256/DUF423 family)
MIPELLQEVAPNGPTAFLAGWVYMIQGIIAAADESP